MKFAIIAALATVTSAHYRGYRCKDKRPGHVASACRDSIAHDCVSNYDIQVEKPGCAPGYVFQWDACCNDSKLPKEVVVRKGGKYQYDGCTFSCIKQGAYLANQIDEIEQDLMLF